MMSSNFRIVQEQRPRESRSRKLASPWARQEIVRSGTPRALAQARAARSRAAWQMGLIRVMALRSTRFAPGQDRLPVSHRIVGKKSGKGLPCFPGPGYIGFAPGLFGVSTRAKEA